MSATDDHGEHNHVRPVDDFGYSGPDRDDFRAIVAEYRAHGYGLIYAKHYAHGVIDAVRGDPAALGTLGQRARKFELGTTSNLDRRSDEVFAQVVAELLLRGTRPTEAIARAERLTEQFRDAYLRWLGRGSGPALGIVG